MRLSDIMGHAGLALWPQVALVIFLLVFFAVAIRVYTRPRGAYERHLRLPLEDSHSPDLTSATQGQHHG